VSEARIYKLLRRFAEIRPGETGPALCLFLCFFLITLSIYIIKPVKESFLIGVTPAWWPYADFITAGLIGFVVAFNARLLGKLARKRYFTWTAVFFIFGFFVFWFIFTIQALSGPFNNAAGIPRLVKNSWPVPIFVFSFWVDVFIVMSVTHFWLSVNDILNPHQAKRTVSFFVTGGLLGGISGALMTSRLVHTTGPANLLLICPAILLLTLVFINLLYADQKKIKTAAGANPEKPGYFDSLKAIRGNKYLQLLTGMLASAMIVGSLINYQFKTAVQDAIGNEVARTSFLASFFLWLLLLSTIFHLITTGRVLKHFGIRLSLILAPSVLLFGSLAVFLVPASGLIIWACILRGSEKTFDNTINQSVRELLYIPIPAAIKYKAKIFIDMFVNRLAVGVGAALFWIIYRAFAFADKSPAAQICLLGIVVVVLALLCITFTWKVYSEYLATVKKGLSRKWQDAHKVVAEHIDIDATTLFVDTLQSREKSSTLYAMNLFQLIQKDKLTPELKAILADKDDELKARSMDALFDVGGEKIYPSIEETLADGDTEAMVREIMDLSSYELVIEKRFDDLIHKKTVSDVERMEAAKLMSLMKPAPQAFRYLGELLHDSSLEVVHYALASAAVHRRNEHLPFIIPLLGNPMIKREAQDALAAYGSGIEKILKTYLHKALVSVDVRSAIPDVLARIGSQKAADILVAELCQGNGDIEQDIIEALYKMRFSHPDIRFKKKAILNVVYSQISKIYAIYLAGPKTGQDESSSNSPRVLEPALNLKIKQLFDLFTLIYPSEDIVKAYQNISQGTRKSFDYSLELLDNVLDRDLKPFLFPIIEDLPPDERILRLKRLARNLAQRFVAKEAGAGDSFV
jgi:AAA family ATP:ADP antiporter